jgi:hypothetical protein
MPVPRHGSVDRYRRNRRFNGATGQGSADGTVDFTAGAFTMTLAGTLTVPHS